MAHLWVRWLAEQWVYWWVMLMVIELEILWVKLLGMPLGEVTEVEMEVVAHKMRSQLHGNGLWQSHQCR
jgi:hypothetical protein